MVLPVFLAKSEQIYSDFMHFSGAHCKKDASGEKPVQLAAYLARNPRTQKSSARVRTHKKIPDAAQ